MHLQFAELPVHDQDRAIAFYTQQLDCSVRADVPMDETGWRWVELELPGARTALHFVPRSDDSPSEEPVLVLVAADVAAVVEKLRADGATILSEPAPSPYVPGQTAAAFADSEGNQMMLVSQ